MGSIETGLAEGAKRPQRQAAIQKAGEFGILDKFWDSEKEEYSANDKVIKDLKRFQAESFLRFGSKGTALLTPQSAAATKKIIEFMKSSGLSPSYGKKFVRELSRAGLRDEYEQSALAGGAANIKVSDRLLDTLYKGITGEDVGSPSTDAMKKAKTKEENDKRRLSMDMVMWNAGNEAWQKEKQEFDSRIAKEEEDWGKSGQSMSTPIGPGGMPISIPYRMSKRDRAKQSELQARRRQLDKMRPGDHYVDDPIEALNVGSAGIELSQTGGYTYSEAGELIKSTGNVMEQRGRDFRNAPGENVDNKGLGAGDRILETLNTTNSDLNITSGKLNTSIENLNSTIAGWMLIGGARPFGSMTTFSSSYETPVNEDR